MSPFHSKKVPNRKIKNRPQISEDLIEPQRSVKFLLGDTSFMFSSGKWHNISGKKSDGFYKENSKLQSKLDAQQERNHLLNLKYEIALSMLTQVTAENHIQTKELEKNQTDKKAASRKK